MKYFLVMGGFAGFAVVLVASLYSGNHPATAVRDASVGCLVGGGLFRMFHAAYIAGLKGCIADRARGGRDAGEPDDTEGARRRV